MEDKRNERYRAPALDKGLDILELLAEQEEGLTQKEIAETLGRTANEIYRMLDRLRHRGYIKRSAVSDRLQLSLKLFHLAHRYPPLQRLISEATPLMREVSKKSEQSCHVVVYDTGSARVVAQTDAVGRWGYSVRVGSEVPLFHTGSGHVLLAFQTPVRRAEMLSEHREVEGEAPMSIEELHARIALIQGNGYERMESHQVMGITNLSFPILGADGSAMAALTVPFMQRIDRHRIPDIETCLRILKDAAQRLSADLPEDAEMAE